MTQNVGDEYHYIIKCKKFDSVRQNIMNCSNLKLDLFRCNLIDSYNFECGNNIETIEHFFLACTLYTAQREYLFHGMRTLDFVISTENVILSNIHMDIDKNSRLFM